MNLKYEEIAKAIESEEYDADNHKESVKGIKERLDYLMGELESAKQYAPGGDGGSEMQYALGDISNLLNEIYFKL